MPSTLTYPGVYIEELPSGVRTITGVATSIGAFVGWAAKGPMDRAVRVLGFDDYVKQFGDLDPQSYLGYAVQFFFLNGGQDAYVVRLAHTDQTIGGLTPAARASFTFDGKLVLAAKNPGKWANDYRVRITRNTTAGNTNLFKLEVLVKPPLTGADAPVVESFDRLSLDKSSPRFVGDVLKGGSAVVDAWLAQGVPAQGATLSVDLPATALDGTAPQDPQPPALPTPGATTPTQPPTQPTPPTTPAPPTAPAPPAGVSAPTPGADGTVLAPDSDTPTVQTGYIAALFNKKLSDNSADAKYPSAEDRLTKVDLFNILCVPGLTPAAQVGQVTISKFQTLCYQKRSFYVVDSPNVNSGDILDQLKNQPSSTIVADPNAGNSALYFPWIQSADPKSDNRVRSFPPSGAVAGVYARTDTNRGVWKAPAGTETGLIGVSGLAVELSDKENGVLNIKAIDCLRTFAAFGTVVWGDRTLLGSNEGTSDYKKIGPRRLTLYIEESLYRGTKWVVFEPNDEPLWAQIRLNVGAFMNTLFRQGAFQGATPREAFQVRCDNTTTTQDDINRGVVNIIVRFRPLLSAEYVVIKIQQIRSAETG